MKLSQKIAGHDARRPFYTFEFFPPRTDQGLENLTSRISRLASLSPLALSITWGAGGATKDRSLDLARWAVEAHPDIDTVLHFTCTNIEEGSVDKALRQAKDKGIHNILALRGDPPRGEEYWIPTDPQFTHAVDLVSYIRNSSEFSDAFCIGVAAYPDGHTDGTGDEAAEIQHLKAKVDAGADFVVTQLFYDVDRFLSWVTKVRAAGITVPIIPGIMPIQTYASFLRLTKLCGTRVPPVIHDALDAIRHDDAQVKDYGVSLAVDMVRRITSTGIVPGVHFCTLNLETSVQRVLERLGWTGQPVSQPNKVIEPRETVVAESEIESAAPLIVDASTAVDTISLGLHAHSDGEAGKGELNSPATWDDFPNGRFGDFKSPAFGDQGPWGSLGISPADALKQWGHPKSLGDLTAIFLAHLVVSDTDEPTMTTTPFSPDPLSLEAQMIIEHLRSLTRKGWWTVASQPAVDGASADDPVVGWGPRARGGYVFQKAFVEFFVRGEEDVNWVEAKIEEKGKGWVHYFAANNKGECRTNVPENGRNAVTWGVFPGQEIAQSTIIERESFYSWKEEAFAIWTEWASCYPPESAERALLESVREERWLVSVVHHDYRDPGALWSFLSDA